jgi:hypothetical protein
MVQAGSDITIGVDAVTASAVDFKHGATAFWMTL